MHVRVFYKKAYSKVSARQQCMYEGP